jgi:hypothetical protein
VFNLFTSFGYFEDEQDNQRSINAFSDSLKTGGRIVLDFMNCQKVINHIDPGETKIIDGVNFEIKKEILNGQILKNINIKDQNEHFSFQEKVRAIKLNTFKDYFSKANLKIEAIFGDYELNAFDESSSDRLIIIGRKL